MSDCYVYFIHCLGTNYVKIGIATNVNKRLQGLQCANPHELKLLGFKEGNKDTEMWFHMFFRRRKIRGEWFAFRSIERALHIFMHYSIADLQNEMDKDYQIYSARRDERLMRNFTPEMRDWLESSLVKISAKMSRSNVRA